MGCDIHIRTEIKTKEGWTNNDFRNESGIVEIWEGRNYELFGVLADVRNRYDNLVISEPKGLPIDSNSIDEYLKECEHSDSYLDLKELKEHLFKNPSVKIEGWMDKETARRLDENLEEPDSYCGGTNNPESVFRRWKAPNYSLFTIVSKLSDIAEHNELSEEEVRIVFWFDS